MDAVASGVIRIVAPESSLQLFIRNRFSEIRLAGGGGSQTLPP